MNVGKMIAEDIQDSIAMAMLVESCYRIAYPNVRYNGTVAGMMCLGITCKGVESLRVVRVEFDAKMWAKGFLSEIAAYILFEIGDHIEMAAEIEVPADKD